MIHPREKFDEIDGFCYITVASCFHAFFIFVVHGIGGLNDDGEIGFKFPDALYHFQTVENR